MIIRSQYRCSFKSMITDDAINELAERCMNSFKELLSEGKVCNASFYKYENMGFLYLEEIAESEEKSGINIDMVMSDLKPCLKPWPEENGDIYFVKMINVYYHHIPEDDIDLWERERTTSDKERIGRVAFVYPEKLASYVRYHNEIVEEGLLKGDKYAFISMHENLLFSYYEEPRNNVNIRGIEQESTVINKWLDADPESHFDRAKAKGNNFLVIPCLFTV